jgi:excisionase family DNA binding protein
LSADRSQLDDSFLTVAEVAEVLKLNQQTVRNWIDQGSLPALRVGRRVRIRRSDFERLLSEGYTAAGRSMAQEEGPSAEDFWGGEPVGLAEPAPPLEPGAAPVDRQPETAPGNRQPGAAPHDRKPQAARPDDHTPRPPEADEPEERGDSSLDRTRAGSDDPTTETSRP